MFLWFYNCVPLHFLGQCAFNGLVSSCIVIFYKNMENIYDILKKYFDNFMIISPNPSLRQSC